MKNTVSPVVVEPTVVGGDVVPLGTVVAGAPVAVVVGSSATVVVGDLTSVVVGLVMVATGDAPFPQAARAASINRAPILRMATPLGLPHDR